MTTTWTPKVGDTVKYVAKSQMSGRLVNVQGMIITKISTAGYITLDHRKMSKFKVGGIDRPIGHEVRLKKYGGSMIPCHIEPISQAEWDKLPRTDMAGSTYARELVRAQQQAEKADA
jgi:hypothetical protein